MFLYSLVQEWYGSKRSPKFNEEKHTFENKAIFGSNRQKNKEFVTLGFSII